MSHRFTLPVLVLLALSTTALATPAATAPRAPALRISLLEVDEARKAIVDDSAEPYFERLQRAEIQVKTGLVREGELAALRAEARDRYPAAVQAFTPEERDVLSWLVHELHPVLLRDYPLFARTPWSFIKVSSDLEGGFPHTRGGHIVLSPQVLASAVQLRASGQKDALLARVGSLLLHEQAHVVQRAHPALFARLFTKLWGFKRLNRLEPGPWLQARNVVNPDGTDTRWIYPVRENGKTRWVWPLILLKRTEGALNMQRDFQTMAVALKQTPGGFQVQNGPDGTPLMEDLRSLPSLTERFPSHGDLYHPNEIAASFFAALVTAESLVPDSHLPKAQREEVLKHWASFRSWARANLR